MKTIKAFATIILIVPVILILGCVDNSETKDTKDVNRQQEQYRISQPIPIFDWSLERDVMIQLYQARNERVATHTIWRSDYGMIEGDCPSIGYPLPYDTQLTNPLRPVYDRYDSAVVEQAEPNGLFSSKNTMATWVRCVSKVNGKVVEAPIYIEDKVTAYPYPVMVNYTTNRVMPVENIMPSVTIKDNQKNNSI